MASYGRNVIATTGNKVAVSADGMPEWKVGGVTIDWATVTAVSGSDATLADGTVVKVGDKYLRYGTVLDVIASTANGGTVGKYGPVLTTATDGRQTMARGESFILNETAVMSELGSDHSAVVEGGKVWSGRLLVGGTGEPTLATVETAFPNLFLVKD